MGEPEKVHIGRSMSFRSLRHYPIYHYGLEAIVKGYHMLAAKDYRSCS